MAAVSAEELRSSLGAIQQSIVEVQRTSVKRDDLTNVVNAAVQQATEPLIQRIDACETANQNLNEEISTLTARLDAYVEIVNQSNESA